MGFQGVCRDLAEAPSTSLNFPEKLSSASSFSVVLPPPSMRNLRSSFLAISIAVPHILTDSHSAFSHFQSPSVIFRLLSVSCRSFSVTFSHFKSLSVICNHFDFVNLTKRQEFIDNRMAGKTTLKLPRNFLDCGFKSNPEIPRVPQTSASQRLTPTIREAYHHLMPHKQPSENQRGPRIARASARSPKT